MNVDIFNEMLKKASYGKGVLKPCIDEIEALRQQLDAANTLIKKYREEMSQEQIGSRMEWQPIDTAPKDGAEILVLLHPEIAERTGYHMEICHYKRRPLFGETWTAQNYGFSTELAGATHWMPLP